MVKICYSLLFCRVNQKLESKIAIEIQKQSQFIDKKESLEKQFSNQNINYNSLNTNHKDSTRV